MAQNGPQGWQQVGDQPRGWGAPPPAAGWPQATYNVHNEYHAPQPPPLHANGNGGNIPPHNPAFGWVPWGFGRIYVIFATVAVTIALLWIYGPHIWDGIKAGTTDVNNAIESVDDNRMPNNPGKGSGFIWGYPGDQAHEEAQDRKIQKLQRGQKALRTDVNEGFNELKLLILTPTPSPDPTKRPYRYHGTDTTECPPELIRRNDGWICIPLTDN